VFAWEWRWRCRDDEALLNREGVKGEKKRRKEKAPAKAAVTTDKWVWW